MKNELKTEAEDVLGGRHMSLRAKGMPCKLRCAIFCTMGFGVTQEVSTDGTLSGGTQLLQLAPTLCAQHAVGSLQQPMAILATATPELHKAASIRHAKKQR